MGTKKLNLDSFKAMQLTSEECKHIKCGTDGKPKPVNVPPGGGEGVVCYFDFEGELLYCAYEEDPNNSTT